MAVVNKHKGSSKFTQEVRRKAIEYARKGAPESTSAAGAGITHRTLRSWLKKGESGDPEYAEFSTLYRQAEATAQMDLIDLITSSGDFRAAQQFLSTRWRGEYGNSTKIDLTVHYTEMAETLLSALESKLEPDVYAKVLEALDTLEE